MNYYISDLHLGHANVLKFDNRPFRDINHMWITIRDNWNSVVTPQDTVYILGDFCWGKAPDWPGYLDQLQGQKVLIRGNHDLKQFSADLKRRFADIKDYKEIRDGDYGVIMCHYPIPFYKRGWDKNVYMLYGHVHQTKEYDYMKALRGEVKSRRKERGDNVANWINVGCMLPYMNYTPRTLEQIIEGDQRFS